MAKSQHPFRNTREFDTYSQNSGSGFDIHSSLKKERRRIYEQLKKNQGDCRLIIKEAEQNIKEFYRLRAEILLEELSQKAFKILLSGKLPYYFASVLVSGAIIYGGSSYIKSSGFIDWANKTYSIALKENNISKIFSSTRKQAAANQQNLEARVNIPKSQYEKTRQTQVKYNTTDPIQKAGLRDYIYFIVRGDTLSKIAKNISGNENHWKDLQSYNNLRSTIIEVNQAILIPKYLAGNKYHLSDAKFGHASSDYDKTNIPRNIILAEEDDSFEKLSVRAFGRPDFGELIHRYNCEINPRFAQQLYKNEHIFIPPKNYLVAPNG
jgi:LysM repeat protein